MFNIEGLGRQLYPELDIWKTASPILRDWWREKHNPAAVAKRLWKQLPELLDALEAAPTALRQKVVAAAQPKPSEAAFAADAHRRLKEAPRATTARGTDSVAAALVLLSGVIWLSAGREAAWPGWTLAVIGSLWLLRVLWKKA
jgi:ubiquinone biosynthesis protein